MLIKAKCQIKSFSLKRACANKAKNRNYYAEKSPSIQNIQTENIGGLIEIIEALF